MSARADSAAALEPAVAGSSSPRAAARTSLASAATFLVLLAAAVPYRADLDPSWHPISGYALGPRGWMMTVAFFAWGASALALLLALRPHLTTRGGRIGLAFLFLGGVGPILAGLFPMDPLGTAAEATSTSGALHGVGAVLGDGLPIAAAILAWILPRRNPAWTGSRGALWAGAALSWIGFLVVTASLVALLPPDGQLGPDVPVGWQMRFTAATYGAWVAIAAWQVLRVSSRREVAP